MINILRYRWISLMASTTILVSACVVAIYRFKTYGYAFSYSVDFTGGTQVITTGVTTGVTYTYASLYELENYKKQFQSQCYLGRISS